MMSYIDGFVIAVPTANKQKFIDHARQGDSVFIDLGATRVVECWGDDVPTARSPTSARPSRPRPTRRWSSPGSSGRTRRPATPPWQR
jgi:hypothetical protein